MSDITSVHNLTGNLGDVRRTNNFILSIDGLEGSSLDLVVQKAFLPRLQLNVLELRHGNDAKKYAGVASWEGGQVTIWDTLSQLELDAVLAWYQSTYDWETGVIGNSAEYKKAGTIREYAANSQFIREWRLQGLWISELDLGELDASQGEMKQISFTIQIDPQQSFAPSYEKY